MTIIDDTPSHLDTPWHILLDVMIDPKRRRDDPMIAAYAAFPLVSEAELLNALSLIDERYDEWRAFADGVLRQVFCLPANDDGGAP